jgi:hypothetical protein
MLKTISSLLFREFPVATSATSHAGRSTVASELECEQPKTPDTTVDMMDAPPIMGLTSGKLVSRSAIRCPPKRSIA